MRKIKIKKEIAKKIGKIIIYSLAWIGAVFAGFACLSLVREYANGFPSLFAYQTEISAEAIFRIGLVVGGLSVCSIFLFANGIIPIVRWLWHRGKHKPKSFLKLI